MTTKTDYSANIRAEMGRKNKTAQEVAFGVAMNYTTFRRRLAKGDWRAAELEWIARYLEVPLEALTKED